MFRKMSRPASRDRGNESWLLGLLNSSLRVPGFILTLHLRRAPRGNRFFANTVAEFFTTAPAECNYRDNKYRFRLARSRPCKFAVVRPDGCTVTRG